VSAFDPSGESTAHQYTKLTKDSLKKAQTFGDCIGKPAFVVYNSANAVLQQPGLYLFSNLTRGSAGYTGKAIVLANRLKVHFDAGRISKGAEILITLYKGPHKDLLLAEQAMMLLVGGDDITGTANHRLNFNMDTFNENLTDKLRDCFDSVRGGRF
jgi:hypothetical protein